MKKPKQENWEKEFNKKFEVFKNDKSSNGEDESFGKCEGGYCQMSPIEIKDFIHSLLEKTKIEAYEAGLSYTVKRMRDARTEGYKAGYEAAVKLKNK